MTLLDMCAGIVLKLNSAFPRRPIRRRMLLACGFAIVVAAVMSKNSEAKDAPATPPMAEWIWSPKYEPGSAPDGPVYFRKVVELPEVASAKISITCDNAYELFINGARVGNGDAWEHLDSYDVAKHLKPGANTIAVKGINSGAGWAGLVAELKIVAKDKKKASIVTDASWKTSVAEVAGWQKPGFDDAKWEPARSFGPLGSTSPWGDIASGHAGGGNGPAPGTFKLPAGFKVEPVIGGEAGSLVAMTFMENGDSARLRGRRPIAYHSQLSWRREQGASQPLLRQDA